MAVFKLYGNIKKISGEYHECIGQIQKDLFVSGDRSFRNPAIVVSVKGTLIAICDVSEDILFLPILINF